VVVATPDAVGDSDILGLGMIAAQNSAISVGGVSVPGPINDPGAAWLWYAVVALSAAGLTGVSATNLAAVVRVPIDSKAMRKLPDDVGIALVAETLSGDFQTVAVTAAVRILLGA